MNSGLFQFLGGSLDNALQVYIVQTSSWLSGILAGPLASALALSFLWMGWSVLQGEVRDPIGVLTAKLARLALISGFALGTGVYQQDLVAAVFAVDDQWSTLSYGVPTGNLYGTLDTMLDACANVALQFVARGGEAIPFGGYVDIASGMLYAITSSIMILVVGSYTIMARAAIAVILAFGPLFIAALALRTTEHLFHAWWAALLRYLVLSALMTTFIRVLLYIFVTYLDHTQEMGSDALNALEQLMEQVVLCGVIIVATLHMPAIAAALTVGSPQQFGNSAAAAVGALFRLGGSALRPSRSPNGTGGVDPLVRADPTAPLYRRVALAVLLRGRPS